MVGLPLAPAASLALASERVPPVEPSAAAEPPVVATPRARFIESFDVRAFMRGNVHVHTLLSDGDSSAAAVLAWYAQHDYRFVAITVHARRFDPRSVPAPPGLTVLAGEEITMTGGGAPVHVNGLSTAKTIGGGTFPRTAAALRWAVARIHDAGGIALVNHPNFRLARDDTTLEHLPQVELLEMHSAHPGVRSDGDAKHPSEEARWAALWQRAPAPFGVAVDDAHRFKRVSRAVPAPPGGAWIEVYGDDARPAATFLFHVPLSTPARRELRQTAFCAQL